MELESIKTQLLPLMQIDNIPFISLGDKLYAVRRSKQTKPPLNEELIVTALKIHARACNLELCPSFYEKFFAVITACQQKMSVSKEVLEFCETVPVQSLY